MSSSDVTTASPELPPVDARLATPGTRYEIYDGEVVYVPPSDEPHGRRQSKIAALLEAHVARDFTVASEMLTRTSRTSDFAPDVSVYPRARDPSTGGRQLEQLAFEVVSTESLSHAGKKASKLLARGVRRVFAIDVERSRALEWSGSLGAWGMLDQSACIEDAALAVPLPIAELLTAADADDPMARALIAKRNPEIEAVLAEGKRQALAERKQEGFTEGKQEGFTEGKQEGFADGKREGFTEGKREGFTEGFATGNAAGRAETLIAMLDARGIALASADRTRILAERDPEVLARWTVRAATCADVAQLFSDA